MPDKTQIVLYTKEGCSLCDKMKQQMQSAGVEELYTLEEVDIEKHAELFSRYRYEIPVLLIDGKEAFRHRLTAQQFRDYLASHPGKGQGQDQ